MSYADGGNHGAGIEARSPLYWRDRRQAAEAENERLRMVLREIAGLTTSDIKAREERDRARYHAPDRSQDEFCPGCWWCCGNTPGDRRARAALAELGEDYGPAALDDQRKPEAGR